MQEIQGNLVNVVHVDDNDEKTLLSLTTRDSLSFETGEDNETANVSTKKRTKRVRTHNEPVLEVESLLAVDLDALEQIGVVDQDGKLTTAPGSRKIPGAIHLEYQEGESGTEGEKTHRFEDVEATDLNIDASSTPPIAGWTWLIHGGVRIDVPADLFVASGETYTVSGTEDYWVTSIESGGTLNIESGSTLNTTGL